MKKVVFICCPIVLFLGIGFANIDINTTLPVNNDWRRPLMKLVACDKSPQEILDIYNLQKIPAEERDRKFSKIYRSSEGFKVSILSLNDYKRKHRGDKIMKIREEEVVLFSQNPDLDKEYFREG